MIAPSPTTTAGPALAAPRAVLALLGAYLVVSWATVAIIALLSATAPDLVTPQAWVRSVIVAATSILSLVFGIRCARRLPRALLRLRIVVIIVFAAIVGVVLFLPLPTWMVVEQVLCAALLLATLVLIFRTKNA
jgi:uncharacterized membrane protein YfcA